MGRQPTAHRLQAGFSLIELLVVIILIGLVLAVAATSFAGSLDSVKVRRAAKDVASALRYTRGQAIVKREEQTMSINVDERVYTAPLRKPVDLPEDIDVKLRTATSDIVDNSTGRIRFFPDGSSTGGRITIIAGNHEWQVNVAWLTGEVTVDTDS